MDISSSNSSIKSYAWQDIFDTMQKSRTITIVIQYAAIDTIEPYNLLKVVIVVALY